MKWMLAALLLAAACSGDETRPVQRAAPVTRSGSQERWRFLDAFAALRSVDPATRLSAVEWIGAHLSTHRRLAIEALRGAVGDEAPEVSSRARQLLRALGEVVP